MAQNFQPDGRLLRYVDAGIVREGPVGDQGDGPFSTGVSVTHRLPHLRGPSLEHLLMLM